MQFMDLRILGEFGLTKNEQEIFLIVTKKGTLSATEIAKETGLNRPYVYYALERLLEKGYLSQIMIRGKKHFKTIDLDQISALEEQKLEVLKKFLTEMKKIKEEEKGDISVEVWKGKYTIKNVHKKIFLDIKNGEEILYLGLQEDIMEEWSPIYLKKILHSFQKHKITERVIMKKAGKVLPYAKTTKYRFLDESLLGETAKIIYHNTIIELLYGTPAYAIIIKNKKLADVARKQFEVFWKLAKSQ